MMEKNLRSLIHEKFPLDLRVKIELLSRRRDIINEEKHQELIQLLQSHNIEGVVPLGPGTNRYAFKLNGFVVKVATDHDGKIDNLKEFKMAKRLYPYVTKIYEVSENGTLLVAEYIQPFASYQEMLKHADRIRDILKELSSVYLIGDVGITSKNFANWGLRVGSDDPVCLDFAYVYEVSSELFLCRNCKTNSMLVPNKDFTELFCPNKGCNKHYAFENIRARIGNDIHRHEIGDLSLEGYKISSSGVPTELDESRSNYLMRKKKKTKEEEDVKEQEVEYDNDFVTNLEESDNHKEGGNIMSIFENSNKVAQSLKRGGTSTRFVFSNGVIIPATAKPIENDKEIQNVVKATAYPIDESLDIPKQEVDIDDGFTAELDESEDEITYVPGIVDDVDEPGELAFSAVMDQNVVPAKPISTAIEDVPVVKPTSVLQHPKKPIVEPIPHIIQADGGESKKPASEEKPAPKLINENFLRNAEKAFSKLANRIGSHMHEIELKEALDTHIKDKKMYRETFYKAIQNSVFRSLLIFCNFSEKDVKNVSGNGTHKEFIPPATFENQPYTATAVFVSRFWNNRDINSLDDSTEVMIKFRDRFSDYCGIQVEWLPVFEERLRSRLAIDKNGLEKIVQVIKENWCVIEEDEETPEEQPEEVIDIPEETKVPERNVEVAQNPVEDVEQEDIYDEEESGDPQEDPLYVEIVNDDDFDIVKVNSGEAYGPVTIPFYTHLDEINHEENSPSIADDRNGIWDWLIHMVPDMMFVTRTPEKYLAGNNLCNPTNQLHIVIMNEHDGEYIMGVYALLGIFFIDDDGNSNPVTDNCMLAKINKLIRDEIGYGCISHLSRSLSMEEKIYTEEYFLECASFEEVDVDDDFDDEEADEKPGDDPEEYPDQSEPSGAENAALMAILNGDQSAQQEEIDQCEEDFNVPEQGETEVKPVAEKLSNDIQTNEPGVFTPIRRKRS